MADTSGCPLPAGPERIARPNEDEGDWLPLWPDHDRDWNDRGDDEPWKLEPWREMAAPLDDRPLPEKLRIDELPLDRPRDELPPPQAEEREPPPEWPTLAREEPPEWPPEGPL